MRPTTFNSTFPGFKLTHRARSDGSHRVFWLATIAEFLQMALGDRWPLDRIPGGSILRLAIVLVTMSSTGVAMGDPTACIQAHGNAQELRSAGRLLEARQQFEFCAASSCPQVIQKDCKVMGKAVEGATPILTLVALDEGGVPLANFTVELDGVGLPPAAAHEPIPVDPGRHQLKLVVAGGSTAQLTIQVRAEEKNQLVTVQMRRPDLLDEQIRGAGYVLAGAGALGLATFAGFAIGGVLDERELVSHAPRLGDSRELQLADRMRRKYVIADVSLGIGLVSLGAATYLLYVTRDSTRRASSGTKTALYLHATAGSGALYVRHAF